MVNDFNLLIKLTSYDSGHGTITRDCNEPRGSLIYKWILGGWSDSAPETETWVREVFTGSPRPSKYFALDMAECSRTRARRDCTYNGCQKEKRGASRCHGHIGPGRQAPLEYEVDHVRHNLVVEWNRARSPLPTFPLGLGLIKRPAHSPDSGVTVTPDRPFSSKHHNKSKPFLLMRHWKYTYLVLDIRWPLAEGIQCMKPAFVVIL